MCLFVHPSVFRSLSLALSLSRSLSIFLSPPLSPSPSLSLSLARACTLSFCLSLSLFRARSLALSLALHLTHATSALLSNTLPCVVEIPRGECHEHFGRGVLCTEMPSRNVREGSVIKLSVGECHAPIGRGVSSHEMTLFTLSSCLWSDPVKSSAAARPYAMPTIFSNRISVHSTHVWNLRSTVLFGWASGSIGANAAPCDMTDTLSSQHATLSIEARE